MTVREIYEHVKEIVPGVTLASVVSKINDALRALKDVTARQTIAYADIQEDTIWHDIPDNVVEISKLYVVNEGTDKYKAISRITQLPGNIEGVNSVDADGLYDIVDDIMWYQRECQFAIVDSDYKFVKLTETISNGFMVVCLVVPDMLDITDSNIMEQSPGVDENVGEMIKDYILWKLNLELANRPATSEVDVYNKSNYRQLAAYYENQFKAKAYRDGSGKPKVKCGIVIPPKVFSLR